ncbi:MAG TPA: hypothetical protein DF984_02005 [Anaerolineaceae bacterium]|jgi:hypothetical protein|nr:hypothetical protein [Anaerolineaceae bacterium]
MHKKAAVPIILTILLLVALCCLGICLVLFASGTILATSLNALDGDPITIEVPAETVVAEPTPSVIETTPPTNTATGTLLTLENTIVPVNDPVDLADRLGGLSNVPSTLIDPDAPYSVGAVKDFWVSNVDTNENFRITAVLRYVGVNTYFWIQEGVDYDPDDLEALGDTFDQDIVPTNREFFGTEWNPGVDGDPHIYILYAGDLGNALAGYFSSADEINPLAHEYSNAHEMFLINSDNVYLWEEYIYGTLAHEFQHMIHWYTDRNESTWMNEGFSMLAELLNGYDIGGHDYSYLVNTDIQLTDWGDEVGSNSPYYGASFLYMAYFLDRFGEDVTKAVVAHPENSMESIDLVMNEMGIRDPLTGEIITANKIFADWAVTNLLLDPSVGDGRYDYGNYNPIQASLTETVVGFPQDSLRRSVHQYGVDSIEFTGLEGAVTLDFTGSTSVSLMPADAYSGEYMFYSNKGDESNMTLTREFDFTGVSEPIEISYHTWYDLEEDYDYLYLVASTDGENWQILTTPSCTTLDISGNSYGCGYNGATGGWIEETVDLSPFAGEKVTLRFEYVTDAAVNGEGQLLDDIRVDAISYFTDFESDDGGWVPDGFARVTNELPQGFEVSIIVMDGGTTVIHLDLSENNTVSIQLNLDAGDEVILVVSGTTPYTNQTASYQIGLAH